jgi:predicted branched-subunit amino acid permease
MMSTISTPLFQLKTPEFKRGFADFMVVWPGVASWGLVTGVAMVKSGLHPAWAVLMSLMVFAGSAQLAAIALIAAKASPVVVVLTAAVMNLRFIVFSAGIAPFLRHLPLRHRAIAGYLNGDMNFAMMSTRLAKNEAAFDGAAKVNYHMGLGSSNWVAWQVSSLSGIALANVFPVAWGLEFAATLALVAMLCGMVKDRAAVACVMAASSAALLCAHWPYRLGLLAALVAGIATAMLCEKTMGKRV